MPANPPKTATQTSGMAGTGLPMAVGMAAVQAWMDLGSETVRFVRDRLQQDIRTQQAMLACTDLEQMRKVQAAFFATAQEQYAAEAAKMMDLVGKATKAGLPSFATAFATARRYDDVPV